MSTKRKRQPEPDHNTSSIYPGSCLICFDRAQEPAYDQEVPEVGAYIGRRIGEDEFMRAARRRWPTGCITWIKAGFSICSKVGFVGMAGDHTTEQRLRAMGFRK